LPGSEQEMKAIAATAKIHCKLTGEEASRANVLTALPACNWLHIASHAASEAGEPLFAEILLSGTAPAGALDKIYAFEIFRMNLRAKIAILSGCETGRGAFLNGEGFEGFVQAFRAAGTPSVIASLWSVDDRATAKFFQAYYQALSRGKTAAQALQAAKLEMLSDANNSVLDWAGFCYFGYDWEVQLESPGNTQRWLALGVLLTVLSGVSFVYWRRRRVK
jgi:CHAT domain-containing protein